MTRHALRLVLVLVGLATGAGVASKGSLGGCGAGAGGSPLLDAGSSTHFRDAAGVAPIVDSGAPPDSPASLVDAAPQAICTESGAPIEGWAGWQALSQLAPCCPAAVPVDLDASMPALTWVPCTNGAAGCQELAIPSSDGFGEPKASRDATGALKWLMFTRTVGSAGEQDLYDIASGARLGAWREHNMASRGTCYVEALLGQNTVTIDGERPDGFYLANGDPHSMTTRPVFSRYSAPLTHLQEEFASDTVFAFDQEPDAVVSRTDVGSGVLLQARTDAGLLLGLAEGENVFAFSEHGTAGWGQLYGMNSAGALALVRSNPNAHVATPASDGAKLYWSETYGSTDVLAPQTRGELWSAALTTDPATVASTATKIADFAATTLPSQAVAFAGLVAVITRGGSVSVARAADGRVVQASPGSGRSFWALIGVTSTELWSIQGTVGGSANAFITRIALPAW